MRLLTWASSLMIVTLDAVFRRSDGCGHEYGPSPIRWADRDRFQGDFVGTVPRTRSMVLGFCLERHSPTLGRNPPRATLIADTRGAAESHHPSPSYPFGEPLGTATILIRHVNLRRLRRPAITASFPDTLTRMSRHGISIAAATWVGMARTWKRNISHG